MRHKRIPVIAMAGLFLNLFILITGLYAKTNEEKILLNFDLSAGSYLIKQKEGKEVKEPVFEYDIRKDTINALKEGGFSIAADASQNYDYVLNIEYSEKYSHSQYFGKRLMIDEFDLIMLDDNKNILFKEYRGIASRNVKRVESFVKNDLTALIRDRFEQKDEVTFQIFRLKKDNSKNVKTLEESMGPLIRLFELKDSRSIPVFVRYLRSCDCRQRWIAKFALLELQYKPAKGSEDEICFEMVNAMGGESTIAYNFIHSPDVLKQYRKEIRNYSYPWLIMTYGCPAIDLMIDNLRCQHLMPYLGCWSRGGNIYDVKPVVVLSHLTEEKWKKRYRGKDFNQEWNEHAVNRLINDMENKNVELKDKQKSRYLNTLIEITGNIADRRAINLLENFAKNEELAEASGKAIQEIQKREK